ncbi:bacillithiol biosynthesis cysteine-adding enzyme BshC [Rhodohalobacter mucosus]|uniref:Putative cysteine ligase BshC n=1 Tax=Rhodohalobacter mucosus TaxID=2079485 RepID=A0A316U2P4_9BACT|nr:bacillithiol biosynthesis cysteine-adding enzyme BshC [Rhodohalobacter mucosus]PWN07576.1 bacillithiol biosynthesis cysteine-adding enzyme BshC [Rhodohalobacter mucosus]
MNFKKTPPELLNFSTLFSDYLNRDKKILDFFEHDPLQENLAQAALNHYTFRGSRSHTVQLLHDYNSPFDPPRAVLSNIDSLEDENTYAVVTGQQPVLMGGTLFTVYKTLTAIIYCSHLNRDSGKRFVPVFWMGDEDHDFDEIASVTIPSGDTSLHLEWETEQNRDQRAADILLNSEFEKLKKVIKGTLGDTDFSNALWELIDTSYSQKQTAGNAFGKLMMEMFGKHGLILAGSNHEGIKDHTRPVLQAAIQKRQEIYHSLKATSDKLEDSGYHSQVMVQESNLFRIDEDGTRYKLEFSEGMWRDDSGHMPAVSTSELIGKLEENPAQFSPNVFLRPLLQDYLLPSIAYVGGPGEVSYFAQMKDTYRVFGQSMPVIIPRFSCTLIENAVHRAMENLPFTWTEYNQRIEDLESEFVSQSDKPDIESIINEWKEDVQELTEKMKPRVGEVDPTLENSAGKASAAFFNELDKLKGKMYRSVKQQESVQLNRISKVKNALFPMGNLQEREILFIYFMNKYGISVWDDLLELLSDEKPDFHFVIEL